MCLNIIIYWLYRILPVYLFLIWITLLYGQPLTASKSMRDETDSLTNCEPDFETNVHQCFDMLYFYKWNKTVIQFQTNNFLFNKILKRFFCRQYTNSLQCIHEMLATCKSEQTTWAVQHYLSQPWARNYNSLCDINQQHTSNNNAPITEPKLHIVAKSITIKQSESDRQQQQKAKILGKSDNEEVAVGQSPDETGSFTDNFREIHKSNDVLEYRLFFQKLNSDKLSVLVQSNVDSKQRNGADSVSHFTMSLEIQG